MGKLTGRLAIVTGASREVGIGAAICRALAAEGADLFVTYWAPYDKEVSRLHNLAEEPLLLKQEVEAMGVRCELLEADLSQPHAYLDVLAGAEQMGTPMILVNNACYSDQDGLDNFTVDNLVANYAVNVRATAMLSVEFARRFSLGKGGRIISLTSGQSIAPMDGEMAYAITKGISETLAKSLYRVAGPKGITVNVVNPGPTDTGWMSEELKAGIVRHFPLGRIGLPEDAARLVAFLASDDGEWITGQTIHSHGGFR
ncbi:MAG: SDR family oxidoreductase [Tumebacillaceae bacterium]